MKIQIATSLSLAVVAVALLSTLVFAEPLVHIVQTGCDTISVDPPLVEIEFFVENAHVRLVCIVGLYPSADSCEAVTCTAPDSWACTPDASHGHAVWNARVQDNCIMPGETLGPFKMVLDPFSCCYEARYGSFGISEPFASETVCFECDKPIQALSSTWGQLKAIYR